MKIPDAVESAFRRVPSPRLGGWAAAVGLVALLSGSVVACVAQVGPGEGDDKVACEGEGCDAVRADEAQGVTSAAAGTTEAIPASPEPNEPQPSPWKPNNPSNPNDELTEPAQAPAASPAASPQPSPWQGHTPPPGGPPGYAPAVEPVQNLAAVP